MKIQTLIVFVLLCGQSQILAQADEPFPYPEIKIEIPNNQFARLKEINGAELSLQKVLLTINRDTVKVKDMHTRGSSSLNFIRKSLSVDLDKPYAFRQNNFTVAIKKFHLLNLVMDKNLWRNRWSFRVLRELGLFPLFNTYCTVWINNEPQGIYLLVEKPSHGSVKIKSPYMIRRTADHKIKHEYVNDASKEAVRLYRQQYRHIYQSLSSNKNEQLFNQLTPLLHLDHYFKWMAFNYLILNGDYADELYFYIDPQTFRFDLIPWDYDDIFARAPHEGEGTPEGYGTSLIFSFEDDLDRAIAKDKLLYQKYCNNFVALLGTIDESFLTRTLTAVEKELEILAQDTAACTASLHLDKEAFNFQNARSDIRAHKSFLTARRGDILKKLNK